MVRGDDPSAARKLADELVAVRCQLGERGAFDALLERWHGPLVTYVTRLTSDDEVTREVVQDTWVRALRGIGRLSDPAKIGAWLFGIARRAMMDRLRARYGEPARASVEIDALCADEVGAATEREFLEDVAALHLALAQLPIAEREALTLFYLAELPLAEVATVLEVPEGTVKSRLFRARRMLAQVLEGQAMEDRVPERRVPSKGRGRAERDSH